MKYFAVERKETGVVAEAGVVSGVIAKVVAEVVVARLVAEVAACIKQY